MNLGIFSGLASVLGGLPAEAVSLVASFVAFMADHYPVRSLIVFRVRSAAK